MREPLVEIVEKTLREAQEVTNFGVRYLVDPEAEGTEAEILDYAVRMIGTLTVVVLRLAAEIDLLDP